MPSLHELVKEYPQILLDEEDMNTFRFNDAYLAEGYVVLVRFGKRSPLSRCILKVPADVLVDHRDRNTLNNKKDNLRPATNQQNQFNAGVNLANTSGFKGVRWKESRRKWFAEIRINKEKKHLGCFDSAEEASAKYQEVAKRIHGEFYATKD